MKRLNAMKTKSKTTTYSGKSSVVKLPLEKGSMLEYFASLPKPKNVPKGDLIKLYCEAYVKDYGK